MAKKNKQETAVKLSALAICNELKIIDRTRASIMREYAKTEAEKEEWVNILRSRGFIG